MLHTQLHARRPLRLLTAALLACLAPTPAWSESPTESKSSTPSACIPFTHVKTQPMAFTAAPKVRFMVGGRRHEVTMDTGSVGVVLSARLIDNYEELVKKTNAAQGWSFLSSSKLLWVGHWVPLTVTFLDPNDKPIATSSVPVLGVEQEVVCPKYTSGPTCPDTPLKKASKGIIYMGVGFGREKDHQPQGTPDKNPLLNLTSIGQTPVTPQSLKRGYIINPKGVTVGLTPANMAGFDLIKLTKDTDPDHKGDWQPLPMCISVNESPCISGSALIDTGIPQMYLTVPSTVKFDTVPEKDLSVPSRTLKVLAPKSTVKVSFPDAVKPVASYGFTLGDTSNILAPAQAIPSMGKTPAAFVNTGRHFLREFQFLYDAEEGQVGLKRLDKTQETGCGG